MKIAVSEAVVLLLLAAASTLCEGYNSASSSSSSSSGRRELFQKAAAFGVATATVSAVVPSLSASQAVVDACPSGSSNCIRTTWTPPAGSSPADTAKTLQQVLNSYPQQGQADVDLGGWSIAEDNFAAGKGTSRIEFKNNGKFSKFFNAGNPFIDDLFLEIGDGAVEVRSSSRIGDSDLGVNQKRLQFFVKALAEKGWSVPDPKY